jgi:flagellar biosynthesis/type III secretory pathway ATPase
VGKSRKSINKDLLVLRTDPVKIKGGGGMGGPVINKIATPTDKAAEDVKKHRRNMTQTTPAPFMEDFVESPPSTRTYF